MIRLKVWFQQLITNVDPQNVIITFTIRFKDRLSK